VGLCAQGRARFSGWDRCFLAGPGTSILVPREVPHTWQNFTSQLAEAIEVVTPADVEGYFLAALHGPHEAFPMLMKQNGIVTLGPPLSR
jgi:hypothetical protein